MKYLSSLLGLLALSSAAQAHGSDMPLLLHALEHGWLALFLLPALLLLPPLRRKGRH